MATPRFAWGIDVGNRALKAIRLVRDGDQVRIDDYEVIEHEQILSQAGDNRETLVQSALANFAQKHSARGGAVAIGVSGQSSFARFIKLPPVDPSKVVEIVKFEAIQQIPFPLEDVEWSYQLFQAPDSPEVEVGIFAMRKELVNQTLRNFTDVSLEVTTVQMSPLAVYNGLYYDQRIEGTTMIVDVGAENSDLIIAEGENIWMRSIPIGGNNFTEALVKSFKLKFPKAEELKRNAATSKYGRQILQAMKPVFSDLVGEIQRSIGFYSSTHRDSRISKVLALGGTFRLPGLQKYLQQNLQLEVARIDRLNAPALADARFVASFNENILSSIGAYGLALQAMGKAKIESSLLPEKIRRERMWKEKTPWFVAAAALFVVGTAVPVGKLYAERFAFDGQQEVRNRIASETTKFKKLDADWKQIETSGNDDRNLSAGYLSLLGGRDVSIEIGDQIARAFPKITAAELAKKRSARRVVELVGWSMRYEPDMGAVLARRDEDFNLLAGKSDAVTAAASFSTVPGSFVVPYHMGGSGGGGGGGGPAPTGPQMRGFLVTIICRTAAEDPTPLVSDTVVKALRDSKSTAAQPKNISFEKVTIPLKVKFTTAYPTGIPRVKRPPVNFVPPPDDVPAGAGGGNAASPPGFNPYGQNPPPAAMYPSGNPAAAATGGKDDPFADLSRPGESLRDDSLVTVLAAVVLDPPVKAATPDKQ